MISPRGNPHAQAASTPVPGGQTSRRLRCLVEGDPEPFTVTVAVNREVGDLKELIHEKEKVNGPLSSVKAKDLVLLRLKRPIQFKPSRTLGTRIQGLDTALSEIVEELDESTEMLSKVFSQQPHLDNLHVIVKPGDDQRPYKRRRLSTPSESSHPPPSRQSFLSSRSDSVSALYEKLMRYFFILVRGTPASGKTSLAQLLVEHIRQQEPAVNIISITGWPLQVVKDIGGWQAYLRDVKGWVYRNKTVFIFDEAQSSYEDFGLWGDFFKNIPNYAEAFAIAFVSYGSAASRICLPIQHTPFFVGDAQRISLRPINHEDGFGAVGLYFSRMEFDDLVDKRFRSSDYYFHQSFFDGVFDATGGHAGAICEFVNVIFSHDSYRQLKPTRQSYTWDLFLAKVSPRELLVRLEKSSVFIRGLPLTGDLKHRPIARIFSNVLCYGSIVQPTIGEGVEVDTNALDECFRNGWLHSDKLDHPRDGEQKAYTFPSPLHRWFVEWKLLDTVTAIPFESNSLLDLVLEVIAMFSPRLLSERIIGPGCTQRPPEAQYQDEFYRCCHAYSNGSIQTFPEFGMAKGRVDFYIPSKQWGVELLREGDRLGQHAGRFSRSGSYTTALQLSDYIMVDCRNTRPKRPHPDIPKLYHVVFSNDHQDITILDHLLQPVHGGELRLLPSA